MKVRNRKHQYLLIVKHHSDAAQAVQNRLSSLKKVLKNKTVVKDYTELTYEIRLSEEDAGFLSGLSQMDGVSSAVLVEFSGDYFE